MPPKPSHDSWKPKLSADSRAQPLSVRNASPVAVTDVATACAASTRPTPPSVRRWPATLSGSAVETSEAATCGAAHAGCASTESAATPATCGAAIEVPDRIAAPLPEPTAADEIDTPGAATSGPMALSPERGPAEVNDAYPRKPGFAMLAAASVTVAPEANSGPFDERTPRNGIVTR